MRYIGLALLFVVAACGGGFDDAVESSTEATASPTVAASETTLAAMPTTTTSDTVSETTASTVGDDVASDDESPEQLVPDDETASTIGGSEESSPGEAPPNVSDFVASAKADLSERLGVDPSAIDIVLTEQVTWRSSALGCPEPDRGYLDVLTPGQRTVLMHNGIEYHYHGGDQPFLCAVPEEPLPASADPNS